MNYLSKLNRENKVRERKLKNSKQKRIERISEQEKIVTIYIKKRFKIRNKYISLFQGLIRFVMLYKRIKFPKSEEINPIFVSFLGFLSNIVSVMKYIYQDEKKFTIKNNSFILKRRFSSRFDVLKSFNTVFN